MPAPSLVRSSAILATVILALGACGGPIPASASDAGTPPSANTAATNTTATVPTPETLTPMQQLGRALFEDPSLSEPAGQSCASCHASDRAFQGNAGSSIAAVARGALGDGVFGTRNVPTLMYSLYSPDFSFATENEGGTPQMGPNGGLFWDGRANFLADQASGPLLNAREMNNPSTDAVVAKVRDGQYADLARQAFGTNVFDNTETAYRRIASAIASYEQSQRFRPFSSRFDDVLRGRAQFTAQEARGFEAFRDPQKGNCITCHTGRENSHNPSDWMFTNFAYENLGVPRNRAIPDNANPNHFDLGLCDRADLASHAPAGTDVTQYCGSFRVPTLRNVAVTAPYMHNGYFDDLREAVKFYATRDTDPGHWYPAAADGTVLRFDDLPAQYRGNVNTEVPMDRHAGDAPRLTDDDVDDIVAFLRTLTDR